VLAILCGSHTFAFMSTPYTFEICAVNIQSALAAQEAGAHRIELCSALDEGGITPSPGLIRAAVQHLTIGVNVLIRPREGDFCYSEAEFNIMLDDIEFCREQGVHGVVVGALLPDGQLDLPKLAAMKAEAGSMEVVHHRAFDFSADPAVALEQLITLGYKRVLSSGQSNSAFEGRYLLQKLVQQADGRISVMPGAGIDAHNIHAVASTSGAHEFHFTGKIRKQPSSGHVIQGLDGSYWQSDVASIQQIIRAAAG
jgi:copper homeostasis protein